MDNNEKRKTELRVSKSGRKYWWNPGHYQKRVQKENERRKKEGMKLLGESNTAQNKPYCYDKDSPSYMRYYEKKVMIRNEYPKWIHMDRNQCREYFGRIWNLINYDEDYRQWKIDTKTLADKAEDQWWEEKKRKDEDYDGHLDL